MATRKYSSRIREEQARKTRKKLLEAARKVFARRGYFEARLDEIARSAKVSVQSLYAIYGSKPALLLELIRELKDEVKVNERARAIVAARTAEEKCALTASLTRDYSERGLDILDAARAASKASKEVAKVWSEVETWRHRGNAMVVRSMNGEDTDAFWALSSHDMYRLLVIERGWSGDRYQAWLARMLLVATGGR